MIHALSAVLFSSRTRLSPACWLSVPNGSGAFGYSFRPTVAACDWLDLRCGAWRAAWLVCSAWDGGSATCVVVCCAAIASSNTSGAVAVASWVFLRGIDRVLSFGFLP